jgi:hypothetical protein
MMDECCAAIWCAIIFSSGVAGLDRLGGVQAGFEHASVEGEVEAGFARVGRDVPCISDRVAHWAPVAVVCFRRHKLAADGRRAGAVRLRTGCSVLGAPFVAWASRYERLGKAPNFFTLAAFSAAVAALAVFGGVWAFTSSSPIPDTSWSFSSGQLPAAITPRNERVAIVVLDGDTIRIDGRKPNVRLVGFNTPETGRRAQCKARTGSRGSGHATAEPACWSRRSRFPLRRLRLPAGYRGNW